MNARRSCRGAVAVACASVLAACLSSAGALPPVRWFDPLPGPSAVDGAPAAVRVIAAPHLGREFVVRVGAREVALDGQHQWVAEPRELVAAVVAQAFAGRMPEDGVAVVALATFELDVTAAPRAHVRLTLAGERPPGVPAVVDEWAAAADRSPAAFAEAMAQALAQVRSRLMVL